MFLNQKYIFVSVQSLIIMTSLLYSGVNGDAIYGKKKPCHLKSYPFFVTVYSSSAACGGVLLRDCWVVLGKWCLKHKLRICSKKSVRAGINPHFQYRQVISVKMCFNQGCNLAAVEFRHPFQESELIKPGKIPSTDSPDCRIATYVYTSYKKPWNPKRPLSLFCASIEIMDCPVIATTDSPNPTIKPDICGPEEDICGKEKGDDEEEKTEDDNYDYAGSNLQERRDDDIHANRGVCSDNSGGPLLCGHLIQGFLLGYTCNIIDKDGKQLLGFVSLRKKATSLMMMTGLNMRSLEGKDYPRKSKGRSLHGDCFEVKFLWITITVVLLVSL